MLCHVSRGRWQTQKNEFAFEKTTSKTSREPVGFVFIGCVKELSDDLLEDAFRINGTRFRVSLFKWLEWLSFPAPAGKEAMEWILCCPSAALWVYYHSFGINKRNMALFVLHYLPNVTSPIWHKYTTPLLQQVKYLTWTHCINSILNA